MRWFIYLCLFLPIKPAKSPPNIWHSNFYHQIQKFKSNIPHTIDQSPNIKNHFAFILNKLLFYKSITRNQHLNCNMKPKSIYCTLDSFTMDKQNPNWNTTPKFCTTFKKRDKRIFIQKLCCLHWCEHLRFVNMYAFANDFNKSVREKLEHTKNFLKWISKMEQLFGTALDERYKVENFEYGL